MYYIIEVAQIESVELFSFCRGFLFSKLWGSIKAFKCIAAHLEKIDLSSRFSSSFVGIRPWRLWLEPDSIANPKQL